MHLKTVRISNFRRLKDVTIDLETDTTIFVGANNSGKTSAASALRMLVKRKGKEITAFDFSASAIEALRAFDSATAQEFTLPFITLDLWFDVSDDELHRVVDLLPSLDWEAQPVGVRLEFKARNEAELLARYELSSATAAETALDDYRPWPIDLHDYLEKKLHAEYEVQYSVLEAATQAESSEGVDAEEHEGPTEPMAHAMSNEKGQASAIVDGLITIDFLDAQRFLSDSEANSRTKDLSKSLSHFYQRNLEQFETDASVLRALHASESSFNTHLAQVFESTLADLNTLGYPGIENPDLVIRSSFTPSQIMAQDTTLFYSLPRATEKTAGIHLPEKYNGLGFKNLIFMVINILDFHQRWIAQEERTPVHLVVVEEPEAHLHAQLQQVFIRKIQEKLADESGLSTQLIVTTHSAHIINESRFTPIRYFRRVQSSAGQHESQVRDVSRLNSIEGGTKEFLERYMKLTHCDLFFADAVILVEGNVERLLLPSIIESSQPSLTSNYLTILEVGGAFAHKFDPLLSLLGIPTLVITDLDSVTPHPVSAPSGGGDTDERDIDHSGSHEPSPGSACRADSTGAITSNPTLRDWHPKQNSISALLAMEESEKIFSLGVASPTQIRIAYQTSSSFRWAGEDVTATGRTFEETFAFENLDWITQAAQRGMGLIPVRYDATAASADEIILKIHSQVKGSNFKKTDLALQLMLTTDQWQSPQYIVEGLAWLDSIVNPAPSATTGILTREGGPSA